MQTQLRTPNKHPIKGATSDFQDVAKVSHRGPSSMGGGVALLQHIQACPPGGIPVEEWRALLGRWKRAIVATQSSWPGPGEGSGSRRKQALLGFPLPPPPIPAVPEAAMGVSLKMGKQKLIPGMIQSTRANPAPEKHPPPKQCSRAGSLLPVNRCLPRTISHPAGLLVAVIHGFSGGSPFLWLCQPLNLPALF